MAIKEKEKYESAINDYMQRKKEGIETEEEKKEKAARLHLMQVKEAEKTEKKIHTQWIQNRPRGAFSLYLKIEREKWMQANPRPCWASQVVLIAEKNWRELGSEAKKQFRKKYKEDLVKYEKAYREYEEKKEGKTLTEEEFYSKTVACLSELTKYSSNISDTERCFILKELLKLEQEWHMQALNPLKKLKIEIPTKKWAETSFIPAKQLGRKFDDNMDEYEKIKVRYKRKKAGKTLPGKLYKKMNTYLYKIIGCARSSGEKCKRLREELQLEQEWHLQALKAMKN